jgi:uncharacterized protein YmfQ (DUF2313 family)
VRAPFYSAADYLAALQSLMPRGRVWSRDPGSVQTAVLAGVASSYAVQNQRANYLLVDAFPASASELLPEWEATLGLPSLAAGPHPSIPARQKMVLARCIGLMGVSMSAYQNYAALLGFAVTATNNAPFRCGQSRCGQRLGTLDQFFNLTIAGSAVANGTVYGPFGLAVLQSELLRVAPAHGVMTFNIT